MYMYMYVHACTLRNNVGMKTHLLHNTFLEASELSNALFPRLFRGTMAVPSVK